MVSNDQGDLDPANDVSYTAVTASVASASFAGIPGLTATVSSASLRMNQTTDAVDSNAVLEAIVQHRLGLLLQQNNKINYNIYTV